MIKDSIDDFLSYADKFEPGFVASTHGATDANIDALQSLSGFDLPPIYRSYLKHLGEKDGGLDLGQGATTRATAVIRHYQELRAENDSPPPGCIVIAVNGVAVGETSLRLREGDEPCVVHTSDNEIKDVYADSLQSLLFRLAFLKYRAKQLKYSNIYTDSPGKTTLASGRELAMKDHFEEQWFSDSICFCGERPGAVLTVNQFPGRGVWIRIASDDENTLHELGRRLESTLGVSFNRTWP